jgi:hypothetical protein
MKGRNKRGAAAGAADADDAPGDRPGGFYVEAVAHLRKQGPSSLDTELRALGPWDIATMDGAEAAELAAVLDFFAAEIPSGRNFELLHALLAHFLRVHGGCLAGREDLRLRAEARWSLGAGTHSIHGQSHPSPPRVGSSIHPSLTLQSGSPLGSKWGCTARFSSLA